MRPLRYLFILFQFSFVFSQSIELELYATGFDTPVNVKHAGDSKLYVVEQKGLIKIVNADGTVDDQPYLDIDDRVTNLAGERGLLALEFHPDYSNNGLFYVNYINNDGNTNISQFSRLNSTQADPNSEVILLSIEQPYANHNGGDLHFGPDDGYLYISLGDGGSSGDPQDYAQNLNSLLGKILRIDVDNPNNGTNYGIPPDNPFIGQENVREEVWSYGLRNPWKFSFDSENGSMWIGDVGQGQIEEINRVESNIGGQNFGWRCFEGNSSFNTTDCPDSSTLTFPIAQYTHSGGTSFRCSITGGYVYRGSLLAEFNGDYFFADFCSDEIGIVTETTSGEYQLEFLDQFANSGWSAFAEDSSGELYTVSLDNGSIYKIVSGTLSTAEANIGSYRLYPNPGKNQTTISSKDMSLPIEQISLQSIDGKIIKQMDRINSFNYTINITNLATGLYSIKVTNKKGSIFKKLIVE